MNGPFGSYGRDRAGLGRLAAKPFWEQSKRPVSSSGAAALPGILGSILCPTGQREAPWPRAGGNQADLTPTVPASLPSGLWTRSPHRGFQKCRAPLASQREQFNSICKLGAPLKLPLGRSLSPAVGPPLPFCWWAVDSWPTHATHRSLVSHFSALGLFTGALFL